jgi:hypothetical protein
MTEYRAYTVGLEGRLVSYEQMTCLNDAEAVAEAQQLLRKRNMELWSGGRLVMRLAPKPN